VPTFGSQDRAQPSAVSWFLTITRRTEGGSLVVSAAGRLGSSSASKLESALLAAADDGRQDDGRQVVLDLAEVDYISSAGLHAIELAAGRLQARNVKLLVRGAEGATKLSLDLAGPLVNVSYQG
jgi:anti-anti-sigma factor